MNATALLAKNYDTKQTVKVLTDKGEITAAAPLGLRVLPGFSVALEESADQGSGSPIITEAKAPDTVPSDIALSDTLSYPEHTVIACNQSALLMGEGPDAAGAYAALCKEAKACKANALFDLKLTVKKRPIGSKRLFQLSAYAAQIKGPQFNPAPGDRLALDTSLARRNSPNLVKIRYAITLLTCLLMTVGVTMLKLTAAGQIPVFLGIALVAAVILLILCAALGYCPNSTTGCLMRPQNRP